MKSLGLLVLVSLACACGGGGDSELAALAGFYQTTKHTLNEEGCEAEGPDVDGMPYFELVLEDLLGTSYLAFGSCDSADQSSCSSGGIFNSWLNIDGAILHEIQASSFSGETGPCNMSITQGVLSAVGDSVSMRKRTYREEDDTLTEEQCNLDEAEARGTSMPCTRYEIIEGTRLSE